MSGQGDIRWPAEKDAALTGLWNAGHSTAEIGLRMGISKNAVIGRARRLKLAPRPSPIKRATPETIEAKAQRAARISAALERRHEPKITLGVATTASVGRIVMGIMKADALTRDDPAPLCRAPRPTKAQRFQTIHGEVYRRCLFPLWDDTTPRAGRRSCDAPTIAQGCPYCTAHAAVCYRQPVQQSEAA